MGRRQDPSYVPARSVDRGKSPAESPTGPAPSTLTPRVLGELLFVFDIAAILLALQIAVGFATPPISRRRQNLSKLVSKLRIRGAHRLGLAIVFWLAGAYPTHHWRGVFGEWQAVGPAFGLAALASAGLLYLTFRDTPRPLFCPS